MLLLLIRHHVGHESVVVVRLSESTELKMGLSSDVFESLCSSGPIFPHSNLSVTDPPELTLRGGK